MPKSAEYVCSLICNVTLKNQSRDVWGTDCVIKFQTQNEDHVMVLHVLQHPRSVSITTESYARVYLQFSKRGNVAHI